MQFRVDDKDWILIQQFEFLESQEAMNPMNCNLVHRIKMEAILLGVGVIFVGPYGGDGGVAALCDDTSEWPRVN